MKTNSKKTRKIRKLIITCTLSAVVLIVSTYTWFIGLQTVGVKPFEIEIATTEGLYLSMDGVTWKTDLDVIKTAAYEGNTNLWTGTALDGTSKGLIPMSSVGDLDAAASRMKIYEKASYTTSPGGYRLLASRVDNYSADEEAGDGILKQGEGYIAFDLFIKNLSGNEYYPENNVANEEAIYLNLSSSVEVKTSGAEKQDLTGIENSIRVGFAQIGRVVATTTNPGTITGIDCTGTDMTGSDYEYVAGHVTGICRNAQIWEPNDTKHVTNALNWYGTSCLTRKSTGSNVTLNESYNVKTEDDDAVYCYADSGATKTYLNQHSNALPTYAISRVISVEDNVDVYDGAEYNTYASNTKAYSDYKTVMESLDAEEMEIVNGLDSLYDKTLTEEQTAVVNKIKDYKLISFPYFTDTMKNKLGMERPTFMTLAPNSITKVRVYIWLEGQDIDNYDFAQLGKTISVKFGFTKERFFGTDIGYEGPAGVPTTPETWEQAS